jgi:serine/threonine-protein kinase
MDTLGWQRASAIFGELLEQPRASWPMLLDQRCRDDAALRRLVERLLAAHESSDTPIDAMNAAIGAALQDEDAPLAAGTSIGPFRVVREIGAGGMGRVYLGSRDIDGSAQLVALKLPATRLLDGAYRERLRQERRALARLEHAHIARLIDAGETGDGRPYFAMEYVPDAVPITVWCDERKLSLDARVGLFLDVCDAVQYAHRNLIVHRDIKPANVLVSPDGTLKLLDFGIAKALGGEDGARGTETGTEDRFFSPAHAAPEQLLGRSTGIGTDIYALGVLLHQLLVGEVPQALEGRSYAEFIRDLTEHDPMLASARIEAESSREAAAARAFASPRVHARALGGDYELIIAKALRRRSEDRYTSVERLADDLRARLEGQAIALRNAESWYRWSRFARRHAAALGLGSAAVVTAIAFGVTATLQARWLAEERNAAVAAEQRASFQRDRAERTVAFLTGLFRASDPREARGSDPVASELLARGEERLRTDLKEDPALRAALLATLAAVMMALNRFDRADALASESAAIRASLPDEIEGKFESALQRTEIAGLRGRADDASRHVADALSLIEREASLESMLDLALAMRARTLADAGRTADAVADARRVLEIRRHRDGAEAATTVNAMQDLSLMLALAGNASEADQVGREALSIRLELITDTNDPRRVGLMNELAELDRKGKRFVEAQARAEGALSLARTVFGDRHLRVADSLDQLSRIACSREELQQCVDRAQQALELRRELLGDTAAPVAVAEFNLGWILRRRLADNVRALPHLDRAVSTAAAAMPTGSGNLALFRLELGSALADLGRDLRAERTLRAALDAFESIAAPRGINVASARGELACLQLRRGSDPTARARAEAALAVLDRFPAETRFYGSRLRDCLESTLSD